MRKLIAFALVFAVLAPVLAAQTATPFTGKWEGTITPQPPGGDGKSSESALFNLTQKGNVITGTAGPPERQMDISNGTVKAGVATFDVQVPDGGPLFKVTVSIVKGRLQGEASAERDGQKMTAKIDAAVAKK